MNQTSVWLLCALPLIRMLITGAFVLISGTIQGRSTGRYPTLEESCDACRGLLGYWQAPSIEPRDGPILAGEQDEDIRAANQPGAGSEAA
jgi:hypothetical protein